MGIRRTSARTTVNSSASAAVAATPNMVRIAPATATTVAGGGTIGGGGGGGMTITSVTVASDASFTSLLDDSAVNTTGGFVRISGTGFTASSLVYFNNALISNTFVNSTAINANIPATAAGTRTLYVFNNLGAGAIWTAGLTISGFPTWNQADYTSRIVNLNVQLLATGDAPLTYSLQSGSSLPDGASLSSSGLITGTVTEGIYSFTVLVNDPQNQTVQQNITLTVTSRDPNFNQTTLLINGAANSNSWIADSSANNFALTLVDDIRSMSFSPYETVWSNFFDGTGDFLTAPTNAALTLNADFTIEFWVHPTASYNGQAIAGTTASSLRFDSGGFFYLLNNGSLFINTQTGSFLPLNVWTHVAIVRNSSTLYIFRNGVSVDIASTGSPASATYDFSGLNIGRSPNAFGGSFTGYISNFRIVKGTALYTANFTPPTTALTAITNTSILTCQSNRFVDNSTNNFTLTRNGDALVSNFGPFVETDIVTGSALFNSTNGATLIGPNSTSLQVTSAFTAECWVYYTTQTTDPAGIFGYNSVASGAGSGGWILTVNASNNIGFATYANGDAGNTTPLVGNIPLRLASWNHIAVTVNGTTATLYVNGVSAGSATLGAITYTNAIFLAGRWNYSIALRYYNGYISNIRISNSLIYTGNFTPPTSSLTATANTQLLTLQNRKGENNHRFVDSSGINNIVTRIGNATQGTFSPFSQTGWSNYFDGAGDRLTIPGNTAFVLPGNFTIECWVYPTVFGTYFPYLSQFFSLTTGIGSWLLASNASGAHEFYNDGQTFVTFTGVLSQLNTWNHIALVRNDNNVTLYVRGNSAGTVTITNSIGTASGNLEIGGSAFNANYGGVGYISNARIVKGTAVYTTNFTPPTSPLTAIPDTSILTSQSNRFVDNSTNNFTVTRNGDASVQAFSPFAPTVEYSEAIVGGSGFFDGTEDHLSIADNIDLRLGTAPFTIQAWIYRRVEGTAHSIIAKGGASTGFVLQVTATNVLRFTHVTTNIDTTTTIPAGTWTHVAVVREGTGTNQTKIYINGVTSATATVATNFTQIETMYIGADRSFSTVMNGFISGLRVNKGVAEYTNNFAVPTAPPISSDSSGGGIVLLQNFTNAGIPDITAKSMLEAFGNAQISRRLSRYGGSSMLFDGTGDYLAVPHTVDQLFFTGNFTIEMWVYRTATGAYGLVGKGTATTGWLISLNASNRVVFTHTTSTITSTGTVAISTWTHVSVVREGTGTNQTKIYINGINDGTGTVSANFNQTEPIYIGSDRTTGSQYVGYIDDLRITRGRARYSANFTPPASLLRQ